MQCPATKHAPTTTRATLRAHVASARAAPLPHRQPAQRRARARHAKAVCERLRPQVARRSAVLHRRGRGGLAGAVPFHRTEVDYNQRGTTCAHRQRACCASSPQTANAVAHACVRHTNSGCSLEATAGTSKRGLAPREGERFLAVQYPSIGHEPTSTSAARRARVASARAEAPPHRQPTQ